MRNMQASLWFLLIALATLVIPSTVVWADVERKVTVTNPATDLWRAVRQREAPMTGITQSRGVAAGQLINPAGQEWRNLRLERVIPWGGWILIGAFVIVAALFILKPSTPIPGGESGKKVKRFGIGPRINHWFMAGVMLFLALTGLVLLFGRHILLPWLGSDVFGVIASAAKEGHDLFGPVFAIALLFFFFQFVRKNLPHYRDVIFLLQLGGIFRKHEVRSGFFNAGEKILFWMVMIFGFTLAGSGFLLLFQNLVPGREAMQLALLVHAIAGIGLTAMAFSHIYMAVSVKGTLPAMTQGEVDENWAKHHHELWYEQVSGQKAPAAPTTSSINDDPSVTAPRAGVSTT